MVVRLSRPDLVDLLCSRPMSGLAPCFHVSSSPGLLSQRRALPVDHPETASLVGPALRALFRVSEIRSANPKSSGPPPWGFVRLQPCAAFAALPPPKWRCRTVGPRGRALGRHPRGTLPHSCRALQAPRIRPVTRLSHGLARRPLSRVFHKRIHRVHAPRVVPTRQCNLRRSRTIRASRHAWAAPSASVGAGPSTGSRACPGRYLRNVRAVPAAAPPRR